MIKQNLFDDLSKKTFDDDLKFIKNSRNMGKYQVQIVKDHEIYVENWICF